MLESSGQEHSELQRILSTSDNFGALAPLLGIPATYSSEYGTIPPMQVEQERRRRGVRLVGETVRDYCTVEITKPEASGSVSDIPSGLSPYVSFIYGGGIPPGLSIDSVIQGVRSGKRERLYFDDIRHTTLIFPIESLVLIRDIIVSLLSFKFIL